MDGWGSSLLNEATHSSPQMIAGAVDGEFLPGQASGGAELREQVAHLMSSDNRRKSPRVAKAAEIRIQQLSRDHGAGAVFGEVQNFSRDGMCIASPVPLVTASVVQCRVGMPDLQFAVPTLMQVLWVEETDAAEYAAGLRYLF